MMFTASTPALQLSNRGYKDYTDADNGIFVAHICMKYLVLQPGEAVCVPVDDIHA